jgi:hypothetical protein
MVQRSKACRKKKVKSNNPINLSTKKVISITSRKIPGAIYGKTLAEAIPGYELVGNLTKQEEKKDTMEVISQIRKFTCTIEELEMFKEIMKFYKENVGKGKFKEKRYGFELWKIIQKIWKYHKDPIKTSKVKLKWNDYKIIRRMFPHGTTYPLDIISGIQLNTRNNRFPRGLCNLVTQFQSIVEDPLPYLAKNILPKLVKKHLGIRENTRQ